MQVIHFAYSFGAIVGPLATKPFLALEHQLKKAADDEYKSLAVIQNGTLNQTNNILITSVHYAFAISGALGFILSIPFAIQIFYDLSDIKQPDKHKTKHTHTKFASFWSCTMLVLFCVLFALYCAIEENFSSFVTLFVVSHHGWSKSMGVEIVSVFWATFALFRFIAIFALHYISPTTLLFMCLSSLVVSLLAFLISSVLYYALGIWIAAGFIGSSMSATFPCGFSCMEQEFTAVSGSITCLIMITSSIGCIINPIFIGYAMQKLSIMWFIYILVFESIVCLSVFLILIVLFRCYINTHSVIDVNANGTSIFETDNLCKRHHMHSIT